MLFACACGPEGAASGLGRSTEAEVEADEEPPPAAAARGGSERNALLPLLPPPLLPPLAVVLVALSRAAAEAVGTPGAPGAPPPCSDVSRSIVKSARRPPASAAAPAPDAAPAPGLRPGDAVLCALDEQEHSGLREELFARAQARAQSAPSAPSSSRVSTRDRVESSQVASTQVQCTSLTLPLARGIPLEALSASSSRLTCNVRGEELSSERSGGSDEIGISHLMQLE